MSAATNYVCRRCGCAFDALNVRTATSKSDPAWTAIVCLACAIEHHNASTSTTDGGEWREIVDDHSRGYYAINPDKLSVVADYARKLAKRAARAHDRYVARRGEVAS